MCHDFFVAPQLQKVVVVELVTIRPVRSWLLAPEVDDIKYDDFGETELDLIEADRRKRMDAVESQLKICKFWILKQFHF